MGAKRISSSDKAKSRIRQVEKSSNEEDLKNKWLLAALGFAAVFAGAANTPIACSIMAMEIFGWNIAPYALVACFMSYYFSGHHGIYKSQRVYMKKHKKIMYILSWYRKVYGKVRSL